MKNRGRAIGALVLMAMLGMTLPEASRGWGAEGHALAGRAAAMKLPAEMPQFFRRAVDQLSYLNPEPDRWRDRVEADLDKALNSTASLDHYIDLELVPESAWRATNRYDFGQELVKTGRKSTDAGFSHFRMLELFQRLRVEFRLWRAERDGRRRGWIEQRIINDAGLLGHYVADGSNPHHTTIHHNGWVGANPHGYTTFTRERGFHFRFEEEFVRARVGLNDVLPLLGAAPRVLTNPREGIIEFLRRSHSRVEELYQLDKREPFAEGNTSPEHKRFAAVQLAAGAEMLRDLWWTAWVTSTS